MEREEGGREEWREGGREREVGRLGYEALVNILSLLGKEIRLKEC